MTLSNFDWTDKASVKWFLLLPTGHEGPYSLEALRRRQLSPEAKVWAEGLSGPVRFGQAWESAQQPPKSSPIVEEFFPLPELPLDSEELPPPPPEEVFSNFTDSASPKAKFILMGVMVTGLLLLGLGQWISGQEQFELRRAPGMSPKLLQRISSDFKFDGWDRKIFFKEYVPADLSHIWLVSAGFQTCEVEATFSSLDNKLLTREEAAKVSFRTKGRLKAHLVDFSRFEFSSGVRIIPGMYEMDLRASHCSWDTFAAQIMNVFRPVDEEYVARTKVVLYHRGSEEFNQELEQFLRQKLALELKNQSQEEIFWQDLQQKFQTLLAITLQIEQHLLDQVEKDPVSFSRSLKFSVDQYARKFGHFLTGFVVANEDYFEQLESSGVSKLSQKRSYESQVKITAKNIGFETMKIIEELQGLKKPTKEQLRVMNSKIKNKFESIKELINRKIIQVTEDRTL